MELPAAEQKLLQRHVRFGEWSQRHPVLFRAMPWLPLLMVAFCLFICRSGVKIMLEAMDLGQESGLYLADSLMPDLGGLHGELISGFYGGLCVTELGAVAVAFFLILLFDIRASVRDRALIFKLYRRVRELETAEGT